MFPIEIRAWDIEAKQMLSWKELQAEWESEGYFDSVLSGDHWIPMLFTGLTDCKGNKIFEGDVCGYKGDPSTFIVIFEKCAFRKKYFRHKWDSSIEFPILEQWDVDNIGMHVIGNIYENPELLKG
jgi:uncharacterized phage protein (TIGR01671 family)